MQDQGVEPIELPDWSSCEATGDLTSGFSDDTVRIGVRSFYEDWNAGNELFTAYLQHVGEAAGREIDVVQVSVDGEPPSDLAVLADFATSQIPIGSAPQLPDCLPLLSRSYSYPPTSSIDLSMPALTAETEAKLWAEYLRRSNPDLETVAALVLDHPTGDALLEPFTDALGDDVDVVVVRDGLDSNRVTSEVAELLAEQPDALIAMTFGEPCGQTAGAVAGFAGDPPPVRLMTSPCVSYTQPEWGADGWLGFRQPRIDPNAVDPDLRAALQAQGWSEFPDESASILTAWWIIDALETGADDKESLVEALLTIDQGPAWLLNEANFSTQGTTQPLALEGAALVRYTGTSWEHVDLIDLDPKR